MAASEVFKGFVYGDENRSCIQTLRTFVEGTMTDAILLIGPSGVGKTHLLTALHQQMVVNGHSENTLYQTGEALVENILRRIWEEDAQYVSHYFDLYMLLLDELSCVYGKHTTQQEIIFFLKAMKEHNIRVICALPEEIPIAEPIISCFPGTILRLVAPSWDTIIRLVEYKASDHNLPALDKHIIRVSLAERGNGFLVEGMLKRYAFQNAFARTFR